MTITYTWDFVKFRAHQMLNGLPNVIYNIEFIYSGSDGEGHAYQISGNVGLGEPDAGNFITFEDLTEDQIISMVSVLLVNAIPNFQQTITEQIQSQIAPPTVIYGKPWVSSTATIG